LSLGHPDQFVKFQLQSGAILILRILNEKHHQKCHDAADGVQLPRVGKMEKWSSYQPANDKLAIVQGRPLLLAVSLAIFENQCSLLLSAMNYLWRLKQCALLKFLREKADSGGRSRAI
jgi:hypothetical protein